MATRRTTPRDATLPRPTPTRAATRQAPRSSAATRTVALPSEAAGTSARRSSTATRPARKTTRAAGSPRTPKAKAAPTQGQWQSHVDAGRVAFLITAVAVALCAVLLADVYVGQTDPIHVTMLSAFGPLAFLVPIGIALLTVDFFRRFEGQRPWLRFEESCGSLLLFVAVLTLAGFAGVAHSLIGDSLSEELVAVVGGPGTVLTLAVLLTLGAVLAFHITMAQAGAAARLTARLGGGGLGSVMGGLGAGLRRARPRRRTGTPSMPLRERNKRGSKSAASEQTVAPSETASRFTIVASSSPSASPPTAPAVAAHGAATQSAVLPRQRGEGASLPSIEDVPPPPDFAPFVADDEATPEPALDPSAPVWPSPSLDLLDAVPLAGAGPTDNEARARVIEETLAAFNVDASVVEMQSGPTVTQFGLRPASGVRVQRITALANDLALALAAPSIRIEAPVPGKPVVGIEIPNGVTTMVTLREILETDAYARMKSPLKIALGKNVSGEPVVVDLARMPHLLIAGATGSGKSVCLNSLIACLLFHNSPERLRLLMIDPKMVELTTFNGVPHLLHPVVTEMDKVTGTLKWVLKEMHRRYKLFGEAGARNIARYNELAAERIAAGEPATEKNKPLPYIVFIIDELADLMMVSPAEVEDNISRLAALARATGIHLVLATQRPSVDVITGVIKANFPARIAFAVSSQVDSRTIIDQGGAEKLLGRGDMLYLPSDGSKAVRVQGTFLSDQEIEHLVQFWQTNTPGLPPGQIEAVELETPKAADGEGENEDKLLSEATKVVREYRRASVSLLQRRLSIGYSRAARLLDQLEERGVVGPSEDGRSRVVVEWPEDDQAGTEPPDEEGGEP